MLGRITPTENAIRWNTPNRKLPTSKTTDKTKLKKQVKTRTRYPDHLALPVKEGTSFRPLYELMRTSINPTTTTSSIKRSSSYSNNPKIHYSGIRRLEEVPSEARVHGEDRFRSLRGIRSRLGS